MFLLQYFSRYGCMGFATVPDFQHHNKPVSRYSNLTQLLTSRFVLTTTVQRISSEELKRNQLAKNSPKFHVNPRLRTHQSPALYRRQNHMNSVQLFHSSSSHLTVILLSNTCIIPKMLYVFPFSSVYATYNPLLKYVPVFRSLNYD
jgi:hypothetical protein